MSKSKWVPAMTLDHSKIRTKVTRHNSSRQKLTNVYFSVTLLLALIRFQTEFWFKTLVYNLSLSER